MSDPFQDVPDASLLDVKLLRMFDLIYSTGSVTRAAEMMGQRQPTASIWLRTLRAALDDALFVRSPAGMLPTPRADVLIVKVRAVLQGLRELSEPRSGFDPATSTRTFCICMPDASHLTMLPVLLAQLRAVAPNVRLVATRIETATAHALQSGEADLALGYAPWLDAGFYQQTLFPQHWVCLVNRAQRKVGKTLTPAAYRQLGHVKVTPAASSAQLLEDALVANGIDRRVVLQIPGYVGLAGIIAASDLVATLPSQIGSVIASMANLRVLACPFPVPPFTVKQHWHERYHEDAGNRWLRSEIAGLYIPR
ncbi:MAG TPA: LysR family transcriptional regulator [Telluria sp.]|jgi:DNA-binding transcriptional LysR family regulator